MSPVKPAGLKLVPVTPVPDHVPPVVAVPDSNVFKFSAAADWQMEVGGVHVAIDEVVTLMLWLSVAVQGAVPTVYVTLMFPVNPAGLKLVPVTPVPDHVPPVVEVPDSNVFKFNAAADWQMEEGGVHVALPDEITLMLWFSEMEQEADPTVYVMLIFPDNPVGLNVFPVTPFPDQVPPAVAVAASSVFKFNAAADWQIEVSGVHAALKGT